MLHNPNAATATKADHGRVIFDRVSKSYGAVRAVEAVSFDLEPGTLVTLLGPSGCGKTTTLRMIAGLEMPTDGRILISDEDVSTLPATYRNVAMVFQSYALFPHMTVMGNVTYGLRMSGMKNAEARSKAEQALEIVGLAGYGERLPSELSGGQQQRVAVARAVVLQPEVLLLDEPLSNLDAKLRRQVRDEIRALQQRLGVTTVYVTHDQEEAMAVSDRIVIMQGGCIAQDGTAMELYEQPRTAFVASFMGDANLLDCEALRSSDGSWVAMIGDHQFPVAASGVEAGAAKLVARSSAISIGPASERTGVPGEIRSCTFLGDRVLYRIETPVGELFHIKHDTLAHDASENEVRVHLDPARLRLVAR
ncbi:ABC transporter ATP-binding protein [Nitratireductor pacificus]|uniref:Iron ABC transporter ATPase n=1 Tax=Nitratireductor pacificus pht-3B TaxID=391937 RepID=K2MKB9_9HYPH|nr:ABC transporter ATP-binding protein [Nitratireductor pacificus]EKF17667.1 iron ABC transporter ATPase [Nitratireductor pacificus pht-3B]